MFIIRQNLKHFHEAYSFHELLIFFWSTVVGTEAASRGVLREKVFLEILQNSQGKTCARVFFNKVAGWGLVFTQVFSCKFCEISKNTFSYRTPPMVASEVYQVKRYWSSIELVV